VKQMDLGEELLESGFETFKVGSLTLPPDQPTSSSSSNNNHTLASRPEATRPLRHNRTQY
jgi:hypothetical protein